MKLLILLDIILITSIIFIVNSTSDNVTDISDNIVTIIVDLFGPKSKLYGINNLTDTCETFSNYLGGCMKPTSEHFENLVNILKKIEVILNQK